MLHFISSRLLFEMLLPYFNHCISFLSILFGLKYFSTAGSCVDTIEDLGGRAIQHVPGFSFASLMNILVSYVMPVVD